MKVIAVIETPVEILVKAKCSTLQSLDEELGALDTILSDNGYSIEGMPYLYALWNALPVKQVRDEDNIIARTKELF